ncbi:MAG: hypothetical protein ACYC3I_14670 [Gemmataceae bacterium]
MLRCLRLGHLHLFIDVETTGVEPRTLELPLNLERPIPATDSAVHGICAEHVTGCPTFAGSARRIAGFLNHADLAEFGLARFALQAEAAGMLRH